MTRAMTNGLPLDDPRSVFADAATVAAAVIGAIRPEQMTAPTPCGEFDVRGLLGHLIAAVEKLAVVGRGENPFAVGDTIEPLADDAWLRAFTAAAAEVQAAWADDATLTRPTPLPWAPDSGAQALGTYIAEVCVHTWDLAIATGQSPTWDEHVLVVALAAIRGTLPAFGRPEMFAAIRAQMGLVGGDFTDPYGPAVPVADDAPLIDQLVAYNGRTPR